jgi:glyoxylase-like metal-dependent hydrolase (beta-lactamase superfamily II)
LRAYNGRDSQRRSPRMPDKVRIGSTEIAAVKDAEWILNPAQFVPGVPMEEWKKYESGFNEEGHLHSRVMTYVVRSQGKTILVDAGVGEWGIWRFGDGHLLDNLKAIDVSPNDIDFVVPTHMHVDHTGWNMRKGPDGRSVPSFPNARYLFQQSDWDHFIKPEVLTADTPQGRMMAASVAPMQDTGLMELVGSEAKITDEVTLLHAPGHTPGQVAVLVQSGGEACLLIGDICHHPAQLTQHEWSPVADIDPALSARSRAAVARMAKDIDALVAGGHFNEPTFGRMIELEGRQVWRGVDL